MGMDAYAVDHEGFRLSTRDRQGTAHPELVRAEQQRVFSGTAYIIRRKIGWVDADFDIGHLGMSLNASAVNQLMYMCGQRYENDTAYSPHAVEVANLRIDLDEPHIPGMTNERDAMEHARAFIACCAKLGLGIEISP